MICKMSCTFFFTAPIHTWSLSKGLCVPISSHNVSARWRDRLFFVADIYKSQAENGEIKDHYINATAGTAEEVFWAEKQ